MPGAGTIPMATGLVRLHVKRQRPTMAIQTCVAAPFLKVEEAILALLLLMIKTYVFEQKLEFLKTCICHYSFIASGSLKTFLMSLLVIISKHELLNVT